MLMRANNKQHDQENNSTNHQQTFLKKLLFNFRTERQGGINETSLIIL